MTTGLAAFNALPEPAAAEALAACCAARRWVARLLAARPYPAAADLHDAAAAELAELDWPDVLEALAAHPRIGQRAAGGSREAGWSRGEQAGAARAGRTVLGELAEANAAYEAKFGFVFLIRAAGRGAEEMLAACRDRLGHDEPAERPVVRGELAQIVRLRLDRMLEEAAKEDAAKLVGMPPTLSTHVLDTALGRPAEGVQVSLYRAADDQLLARRLTDADGRIAGLQLPLTADKPDEYEEFRLVFATAEYFRRQDVAEFFYAEVAICFRVGGRLGHYHVPLLLNPFGYSTYRGS
jgi:hydroxyisourate hydrolase